MNSIMPYRRKTKKPVWGKQKPTKYVRRRRYKRTGVYGRMLPPQNRLGLIGFPSTRMVRMRYCDSQALTSTSGSFDFHAYRTNSIFDPDETGTGTQPLGYDQWLQFYNHYIVVGSKINMEISWVSSSASAGPLVVGVYLGDDSSLIPADYLALKEQGKGISLHINPSSANQSRFLNMGFSAKRFFNITNIKDNWTRLGAQFGTNPAEMANFIIYAQAADLAATNACRITITIDYMVLVSEPKELPQSS